MDGSIQPMQQTDIPFHTIFALLKLIFIIIYFTIRVPSLTHYQTTTVGKGEIARYEQFLLFPQCFQKACFPGASKGVVWEWVN